MAISLRHAFNSAKGDGSDTSVVRPSNWNAEHTMTMATSKLLGRMTAATGPVEELSVTAYMVGLLNTADAAALALALGLPTTGDARLTYKTVAPSGWLMMNDGTFGNTGSNATTVSTLYVTLFTLFYTNMTDANAPVLTSAGGATTRGAQGSAATAWAANVRMTLPKALGRAIILGGAGAGLTARTLGQSGGAETHTLATTEIPNHTHPLTAVAGTATWATPLAGTATWTGTLAGDGTGTGTGRATWTTALTGSSVNGTGSGSFSGTTGDNNATHTHGVSGTGTSDFADRSLDHAHTQRWTGSTLGDTGPVVGGNAAAGGHGGGGVFAPQGSLILGGGGVDHKHNFSFSGAAAAEVAVHQHSFGGSVSFNNIATTVSIPTPPVGRVTVEVQTLDVDVTIPTPAAGKVTVSIPTPTAGLVTTSTTGNTGNHSGTNGQPHNNMQPFSAINIMVKW